MRLNEEFDPSDPSTWPTDKTDTIPGWADEGLASFVVTLTSGQQYRFWAEDPEHAAEQARDAEPDDPVVNVEQRSLPGDCADHGPACPDPIEEQVIKASTPDPDAPPCEECRGGLAHYLECSSSVRS